MSLELLFLLVLLITFPIVGTVVVFLVKKSIDQARCLDKVHLQILIPRKDSDADAKQDNSKDFEDCLNLLKEWTVNKEENNEFDEGMDDESVGIKKIFNNYDYLKDRLKIAGIYVDGKLEAFTMGELINSNMALIHIEKANPNIEPSKSFVMLD